MNLESFSYDHHIYGCIDVDIQEEIDYKTNTNLFCIIALYWIEDNEYAVSFSCKKDINLTMDDIIKKINTLIKLKH